MYPTNAGRLIPLPYSLHTYISESTYSTPRYFSLFGCWLVIVLSLFSFIVVIAGCFTGSRFTDSFLYLLETSINLNPMSVSSWL